MPGVGNTAARGSLYWDIHTLSFHSSPSWYPCFTHNSHWRTISVLMTISFPYKDTQICLGTLERKSMYWNMKKRSTGWKGSMWCKFSLCFYNPLCCFVLLRGERKHTKARHDSIITHGSSSAPSALEHAINSPIHKHTLCPQWHGRTPTNPSCFPLPTPHFYHFLFPLHYHMSHSHSHTHTHTEREGGGGGNEKYRH